MQSCIQDLYSCDKQIIPLLPLENDGKPINDIFCTIGSPYVRHRIMTLIDDSYWGNFHCKIFYFFDREKEDRASPRTICVDILRAMEDLDTVHFAIQQMDGYNVEKEVAVALTMDEFQQYMRNPTELIQKCKDANPEVFDYFQSYNSWRDVP